MADRPADGLGMGPRLAWSALVLALVGFLAGTADLLPGWTPVPVLGLAGAALSLVVGLPVLSVLVLLPQARRLARTQAAAADLEREAALLRLGLEAAGEGLWEWVAAGGFVRLSAKAGELFGLSADGDRATLEEVLSAVHPEDREGMREKIESCLSGRTPACLAEVRVALPGGGVRWVRVLGKASETLADGRPGRVVGTAADVTVRRELERRMTESEARHRAIVQDQTELICRYTPDGVLTFVNEAYAAYFGKTVEDLTGRSFLPLLPPEDRRLVEAQMAKLSPDSPTAQVEHRVVMPGGEMRWQRWTDRAIYDRAGRPVEYQAVGRDITARKLAELALVQSEALTRGIFDAAGDGIVTVDEHGTIEMFNPAAERLFGYRATEVVGKNICLLMTGGCRQVHEASCASYLKNRAHSRLERVWEGEGLRKDGAVVPLDVSVADVPLQNRIVLAGIFRDITARKRLERREKDFVSTVSHELRTPLTSVHGSLGLLAGGAAGPLTPEAERLVRIAHDNSARLIDMVGDILTLEKAESGALELRLERVSLAGLAGRALEHNRHYSERFGVRLALEPSQVEAWVLADPGRVHQVMDNLLSNAAKFSPSGAEVRVGVEETAGRARFFVADRGPGVPPEVGDRVFDKYFQADVSDRRRRGGTGLGLTIAKALVERMGGKIGHQPGPEGGSVFFFELPLARPAAPESGRG